MRRSIVRCSCLILMCSTLLLVAAASARAQQSKFDGSWSVLLITDVGTCDRAYRYAVQILGGQVRYFGDPGIQFDGQVGPNGRAVVSVRLGDKNASGTGVLSGDSGEGTWRAFRPGNSCSGRWEAERRVYVPPPPTTTGPPNR